MIMKSDQLPPEVFVVRDRGDRRLSHAQRAFDSKMNHLVPPSARSTNAGLDK
jgi:hypothetical protein